MKFSNPKTRNHLSIKKAYHVLEIGGGNYPHPRANVVVDKYVDSNYHRSGNIKVYPHQKFVLAEGESLPFEDQSFDYIICCHVLEHVDDPIAFLKEQTRVASRGYIETPSIIGEYLMPKESHKWLIQEIDGKIIMYDKETIGFVAWQDFGNVFLEYLPKQSVGYKIMQRTHNNLTNMVYEWSSEIEVLVNPESSYYRDFFTKPWDVATCNKLLHQNSFKSEAKSSMGAIINIVKTFFSNKEKSLRDPVI
ncbi:class I SAM-dependent methyltransferase [Pedobacter caeni]|uniref:Methyltransferase domain-containing protein n=1 Tax=Pedobacter caeni TaxID=288992 RepID=A0A1M4WT71_9SPHI|nr:class I SAM-dependent methyltransferase [Pedobacter caeni]SHE84429.1 Methyltransferase domain-containing protein [Pedobacter caeni]